MICRTDVPPLGTLRIASPEDASRISVVATAAFRYSPLFAWERPNHEQYPEDTIASYHTQFLHQIQSDDHVVLVQEDAYMQDENREIASIVPDNTGWTAPKAGDQVIVAVISIKLEPGSTCKGVLKSKNGKEVAFKRISSITFWATLRPQQLHILSHFLTIMRFPGSYLTAPQSLGRDLNRRHYDDWGTISAAARKKNKVHNDSIISMIVVHPAYWRRGHGTRLATWARDLSIKTKAPQCVSAAPMSQRLLMSLGYKRIDVIVAEGDEDDPRGVQTLLLRFGRENRGGLDGRQLLRWILMFARATFSKVVELTKRTLGRMRTQGNDKGAW
ncbi:hypothetical protein QBC40DRAFT_319106 [Triangularia verruculosa]|uniref:N-acetyltransferase domain-containing protein n=1 Tax=Triangularia verruculosa TaxID=2587418 RepID=A0AAN6XMF0_9PEZI|nr:hypothetical protein QBC40DRAFT_319106 [Triangularia verruculosa]